MATRPRYTNRQGERYGRLVVQEFAGYDKHHRVLWRCICDCGVIKNILSQSLKSGSIVSCGCFQRESASLKHRQWRFGMAAGALYGRYKADAKRRSLNYDLTREEFTYLTRATCYYCGADPSRIHRLRGTEYQYNGIDRIDNTRGYTFDNCVTCCMRCNYAKHTMTRDEYIALCKTVAVRHK